MSTICQSNNHSYLVKEGPPWMYKLQLQLTLEPHTTPTPKSKGHYLLCTWTTKMRGNGYMILSKSDRLINSGTCNLCLVYKRIGYYISNKLLSVNKHRLY